MLADSSRPMLASEVRGQKDPSTVARRSFSAKEKLAKWPGAVLYDHYVVVLEKRIWGRRQGTHTLMTKGGRIERSQCVDRKITLCLQNSQVESLPRCPFQKIQKEVRPIWLE